MLLISLDSRHWTTKPHLAARFLFFFFQQCQSVPDLRSITANNRLWLIALKWGLGNDWNLNKSSFSASGHIKHTSGALQWVENTQRRVFWGQKKGHSWQCSVKPPLCSISHHLCNKFKWNLIPCCENKISASKQSADAAPWHRSRPAFTWKHSSVSKTNNSSLIGIGQESELPSSACWAQKNRLSIMWLVRSLLPLLWKESSPGAITAWHIQAGVKKGATSDLSTSLSLHHRCGRGKDQPQSSRSHVPFLSPLINAATFHRRGRGGCWSIDTANSHQTKSCAPKPINELLI